MSRERDDVVSELKHHSVPHREARPSVRTALLPALSSAVRLTTQRERRTIPTFVGSVRWREFFHSERGRSVVHRYRLWAAPRVTDGPTLV